MSIQSQIDRITDEVSGQNELIQQIKTVLAEKAAGVELPPLSDDVRATSDDMAQGKCLYDENGNVIEGNAVVTEKTQFRYWSNPSAVYNETENRLELRSTTTSNLLIRNGAGVRMYCAGEKLGNAKPSDVRQGVTFTSAAGFLARGEALLPGGGSVYPDGAFAPVTSFTDGKQYALVALIDGVYRFINTTTYNDYTMNATEITIDEDAGDYVIFDATPALFTAVASGDGFLLQNGSNYLHGTSSGGTALRVGTTQAVWTVDDSATGGFSEGKYYAKEDANAVWLLNVTGGYNWGIKFETAGSFGYDRDGRDGTYSTGFVSLILYEYVAGEGEINPVVDTSDAKVSANQMLVGASAYANGRKVEGNIQRRQAQTITPSTTVQEIPAGVYLEGKQTIEAIQTQTKTATSNGTVTPDAGKYLSSVVVDVPVGNTGSTVKTGTTTSGTINTGLSEIDYLVLYKTAVAETGVIQIVYRKDTGKSAYTYCSSYSTYSSRYAVAENTNGSVSGGTFTWGGSSTQGLSSGKTYNWIAIGK